MRYLMKTIIALLLLSGYILNMYFLTVDPKIRDYQWINKVGIIVAPLGSIMGWVYELDTNTISKKYTK